PWQWQLYKCRFGRSIPAFQPEERHPFIDGRGIKEVFVDARGNAFLLTSSGRYEYVKIAPRLPLPKTKITLEKISDDTAAFTLTNSSSSQTGGSFMWRLDDGSWIAFITTTEVTTSPIKLQWLSNGVHTVEAYIVDEELQTDAAPARVQFEIKVD